jgi:tetratricopeptide (TPR) repeat protein
VVTRLPVPAYVATLGDLYWASGHKAAAYRQYELVRAQHKLLAANGVQPDPEMTLFLADHGIERARAIRQARHQYNKRPSIYAADALAWALYAAGAPRPAQRYVGSALRLGTRDASLFFHAGMIHKALGNISRARSYLRRTLAINPHFSIRHSQVAARALAALRSP